MKLPKTLNPFAILDDLLKLFAARALENNYLNAEHAFTLGKENNVAAQRAIGIGYQTHATHYGELAYGAGFINGTGDCQMLHLIAKGKTTDATPLNLTLLDGNPITIPQLTTWNVLAQIVARRTDATGQGAAYTLGCGLRRDAAAATTALISTVQNIMTKEDVAAWNAALGADTTNGALRIQVTGEAAKTINWVALLTITQTKTVL